MLKVGTRLIDGFSVLDLPYLIIFKMRAWLDLSIKHSAGKKIDSKDINKHRNDVLRLATEIDPETRIKVSNDVFEDIRRFLKQMSTENIRVSDLGIKVFRLMKFLRLLTVLSANRRPLCDLFRRLKIIIDKQ